MEFVNSNNLIIRNIVQADFDILDKLEQENMLFEAVDEIKESFHDDFYTEGEKYFALEINGELAGLFQVNLEKPFVYFNIYFLPKYYTRIYVQQTIFNFVKYIHLIHKHRQIVTYTSKFNFLLRSVLENFKFERVSYDKIKDIYTYTLFTENPTKA